MWGQMIQITDSSLWLLVKNRLRAGIGEEGLLQWSREELIMA